MVVARSSREVFDYIPRADRDKPAAEQTVFHLRRLPTFIYSRAKQLRESDDGPTIVLRAGIAGWTNFADKSGQQIECKHEKGVTIAGFKLEEALHKDLMEWIDQDLFIELMEVIRSGNTLSDEDAKN